MSFRVPQPPLALVYFRLELPGDSSLDGPVVCHATGQSPMKRRSLWSESNVFGPDDDLMHAPADWIHHLALVVLQDRPNSQERLLFGLTGGLGAQDPLF